MKKFYLIVNWKKITLEIIVLRCSCAVLCELVYESGLLNHIMNEPALSDLPLGQVIYKDRNLKVDIKSFL